MLKSWLYTAVLILVIFGCYRDNKTADTGFSLNEEKIELPAHPRLFFTEDEESKIKELAEKDTLLSQLFEVLYDQAELCLTWSLLQPSEQGEIDLGTSRELIKRVLTLSLAYRIFDDERYLDKVEAELLNVANFKSWHPEHFLDVAETTTAVAIGYDWCYHDLSEKTRHTLEKAILEKAFAPAWPVYENGDDGSWAKRNTNWNVVCNSGLVNGAMAIADKYPEEAAQIMQYAIEYVPNNLEHFGPNGVYYEGPTYWNYTYNYLMLLLDNLGRNLGSDYGLSDMPGIRQTVLYYIRSMSPTHRTFNFADASTSAEATLSPVYFFSSQKYNQPEAAEYYRNLLREALDTKFKDDQYDFPRLFFLAIPWYDQSSNYNASDLFKLKVYKGEPDLLVFNGAPDDKNELFLIAKGGKPDMAHNQLDVGSFVLENQQIRWGIDLGSESYDLPDFWDYKPDGVRWHYFVNTNLSHNTLNIDGKIAYSRGTGTLIHSDTESEQPFGIYDLTTSYSGQATSVMRGFKMLEKNIMLCQDEVILEDGSSVVNWRFVTDAKVNQRGSYVELSKDEKLFYLYPYGPTHLEINVFEAQSNSDRERKLTGTSIIEICTQGSKDIRAIIAVLMGDNLDQLTRMSSKELTSLKEW